jgi:signal transduction histidine kinase
MTGTTGLTGMTGRTVMDEADGAIARYGLLEESDDRGLRELAELAALACDVPGAAVNIITSTHQHQVATAGVDRSICERDDSMCAVVLDEPAVVVVPDARADERFEANPFVSGRLGHVRFYASAPLVTSEGIVLGRLCVFDDVPHDLGSGRARVLAVLASRAVDVLELRLRSRQLRSSLAELTAARDQLDRSNELLTLFAAQVSHDLRSPLTALLANVELLLGEPAVAGDRDATELAQAAVDAGHRMAALIDSILDSARRGANQEQADVALEEVLDHVVDDLRPALTAREARIDRSELPVVRGDGTQLYAVLLNLVSNAVKFVPPGRRPVVGVEAERSGEEWRIVVSDNGDGVPPEQREQVFALHARADHSVDGSGIGLATARRIVEVHGGRTGIADAPGGGAAVWFTLPA